MTAATGIITTVAGTSTSGYNGDNIAATSASLYYPFDMALDASGNLYIADTDNYRVRKVTAATGLITTVAGTGTYGYSASQDGGAATSANIGSSYAIAVDGAGNIYLVDDSTQRIRRVSAAGIISTVAGTGTGGYNGDGIAATNAELYYPYGLATDAAGNVYIADEANQRVRKITVATGVITTVAGNGTPGAADNTAATGATVYIPLGVALDSAGNLYIADYENNRARKVTATAAPESFATTNAGSTSTDSPKTTTLSNNGNASLLFTLPSAGTNPTFASSNFTLSNSSTCPIPTSQTATAPTLGAGATCTDVISFTPVQGGTISDSLVTTDNALNVSTSTQAIPVTGTGVATVPIVTSVSPNAGTSAGGTSVTITGTVFTGATAVKFGGTAATSFTVVSATSITAVAPAGATGVVDVTVTTASGTSAAITADHFTYTTPQTITFPQPATPVVNGAAPVTLTASASSGLAVVYSVISGPATVSGSTLTFTGAGTVVVEADQPGNGTFAAAPSVRNTITVTAAASSYVAPSTAVAATSATQTATVTFTTAGTLGSINVVTQGATGLDFAYVAGGTNACATGTTYAAGNACTVQYTFSPKSAGLRLGGISLTDSTGALLASSSLSGIGNGPQAVIYPGVQTTVVPALDGDAFGLAVDASGNLYAGSGPGYIDKETLKNGVYTQSQIGSGLSFPAGIAVDGLGNVWIADGDNGRVVEEVLNPHTGAYTQLAPFTGFAQTLAVAVDAAGDVYIGSGGQLLKETPNGSSYTQTVISTAFSYLISLAVDSTGNIYAADGGAGVLYKETLANGSYTQSTIASGLGNVNGVVVDASGTVYTVADGTSNQVLRYAPNGTGGYLQIASVGSFARSNGIALDGSGNVFVTDDGNGDSVAKIDVSDPQPLAFAPTAVGASSSASLALNNIGTLPLAFTGLAATGNFAVDSATSCATTAPLAAAQGCTLTADFLPNAATSFTGSLTVTDNSLNPAAANQVVTLSGTGLASTPVVTVNSFSAVAGSSPTLTATIVYGGIPPTGTLSFIVGTAGTSVTASCTASNGTSTCTAAYPLGSTPVGSNTITATFSGDSNYTSASGTGTLTVVPGSYVAPATPVATPAATQTVTLVFNTATTLNASLATAFQVVTQGAPNLDFTFVSGGSCAAGASYTAGSSCTVMIGFTPTAPGQRLGAVLAYDNSATPLLASTAYLSGIGNGGLGLFEPATQTTVASGLAIPRGPSIDALGNLYFSEQTAGTVDKIAAATGTKTILVSGVSGPGGTAVDGAGNLFFNVANAVYEIPFATGTPTRIASVGSTDNILLVDGAGNLYYSDPDNGYIYEIAAGTHAAITLSHGFGDRIIGMAMDASGNIFAAGFNTNTLYELPAGNYNNPTLLISGNGLSNPHGVAIDPAGNLYVTNHSGTPHIIRYAAGTYAPTTLAAQGASGITIDAAGNLYTTDDNAFYSYQRNAAAPFTFASTSVGSESADSPKSATFENDGNAGLTISALATTNSSFALDKTSTCTTGALASAATCVLSADFTPATSGALSGFLNVSDNSSNSVGVPQTIALNGTGTAATATVVVAPETAVFGTPTTTLSATVTYAGSTAPTGAFTFSVGSAAPVTASCTAAAGSETCTAAAVTSALAAGSYTITGSLAGDANFNAAMATGTLVITPANTTVTVQSTSISFGTATTALHATVAYAGSGAAPTGAFTFQIDNGTPILAACTPAPGALTCTALVPTATLPVGVHTLAGTLAADTNYSGYTGTGSLTVTAAAPVLSVPAVTLPYGTPTTTFTASLSFPGTAPTGALTFQVDAGATVAGICTASGSSETCTALYVTASLTGGTHTLKVVVPADPNHSAVSGTAVVTVTSATPAITLSNLQSNAGAANTTLSATITFAGAAPTGAFTFTIDSGAAVKATCTAGASSETCTASYPTATLSVGTHTINGSLAADTNYAAASAHATLTVINVTPTVTVAPATITYGTASTTLTANVAFAAATAPAGAFTFAIDGGPAVVATCSGTTSPRTCTATVPTATLTAGAHTITGTQAADATYVTASGTATLTVTSTSPTIAFTVPNHTYGDAPFPVAATSNSTGVFTYAVLSGPATVAGSTVTLTGVGTVVLQASEAADANFGPATKQASFVVTQPALTVAANNATRLYGAANPSFTGTVTGSKNTDTFTESFTTTATLTSAPGTYPIVPAASGTDLADYTVSTTYGTLTITKAPATASVMASATTVNPNASVTLNASVVSTTSGTPTGTVIFLDNGNPLGTVTLVNGAASYTTATLSPATTHVISVSYSGDLDFLAGSATAGTPVTVGALDFTFTTVGPTAYSAAPGSAATYNFSLSPLYGSYAATVTFAVTGLPAGATATFSPSSVVAATGTAQPVVLTVQTPQPMAENKGGKPFEHTLPLLALLGLPFLGSRRVRERLNKRVLLLLLLAAGLAGTTAMTGCGTGRNGFLLEQPSTYTLNVTATSGSLEHSQTVTLTVQ